MNDRFDYLSSRTLLEGREIRRYKPFDDAPVEEEFNWKGFARNMVVGTLVAVGCIALAAIPAVGPVLTGALIGAALGAFGETVYMTHKEISSGNVRDTYEMGRNLTNKIFEVSLEQIVSGEGMIGEKNYLLMKQL